MQEDSFIRYTTKIRYEFAVQIDEDLRIDLIEKGFVNPKIGDYYTKNNRIVSKEIFEEVYE